MNAGYNGREHGDTKFKNPAPNARNKFRSANKSLPPIKMILKKKPIKVFVVIFFIHKKQDSQISYSETIISSIFSPSITPKTQYNAMIYVFYSARSNTATFKWAQFMSYRSINTSRSSFYFLNRLDFGSPLLLAYVYYRNQL